MDLHLEWGPWSELVQRVVPAAAWTLVHSLWQGMALAGAVWLAGWITGGRRPRVQYALCGVALAFAALAVTLTFTFLLAGRRSPVPSWGQVGSIPLPQLPCEKVPAIELLLIVWLAVCLVNLLRIGVALYSHYLTRIRATLPPYWLNRLYRRLLASTLIDRAPALVISPKIESPMVAGLFWPWIGLPSGSLDVLSREHLETILIHELEHVKQRDFVVNIVVQLVVSMMWFHPCIRWIAIQMSREREYACDQAVLSLRPDPARYASALVVLESQRARHVVAFFTASIKPRVRRILGQPEGIRWQTLQFLGLVACMLLSLLSVMLLVVYTTINSPG